MKKIKNRMIKKMKIVLRKFKIIKKIILFIINYFENLKR